MKAIALRAPPPALSSKRLRRREYLEVWLHALMLPLAHQVENLQNFTSFCRAIIEVQKILRKAQFKAWKVFHTLFGLYWSMWIFRRDCRLSARRIARVARKVSRTIWRSVGPAPAILRALPPIPDKSTFFPVTPIVLDLTNASMITNHQFQNSTKVPQTHPLTTLGNGNPNT